MERRGCQPAIVADDLTGALDTGVQFARHGLSALVLLEGREVPAAEVVVITTDSRDEASGEAYRRARAAAASVRGRFVYKKIDSAVRGNVGAELDGLMDELGIARALVVPAFPAAGRTTVNDVHMVRGVPLAESSFARDPLWPATESHLTALLARQTRREVGHIRLEVVGRGPEAVAAALRDTTAAVVAADAVEERHLAALAAALVRMEEPWLPCGSAGLAEELPAALGIARPARPLGWRRDDRPCLVVAGSRHPATAGQLRRASDAGELVLVELAPEEEDEGIRARVDALLGEGRCVGLAATFSQYREGRGKPTAEWLAREAARVVNRGAVAGVFLTGGDIARAFCRALGASALRPLGEVQPGVAAAVLSGGPVDGLRVVTKAGAFGDDLAVLRSIACLRGG